MWALRQGHQFLYRCYKRLYYLLTFWNCCLISLYLHFIWTVFSLTSLLALEYLLKLFMSSIWWLSMWIYKYFLFLSHHIIFKINYINLYDFYLSWLSYLSNSLSLLNTVIYWICKNILIYVILFIYFIVLSWLLITLKCIIQTFNVFCISLI